MVGPAMVFHVKWWGFSDGLNMLKSEITRLGDGHQPNSRGLYTHYKDSLLKVVWPSPKKRDFWPWHNEYCFGFNGPATNTRFPGMNLVAIDTMHLFPTALECAKLVEVQNVLSLWWVGMGLP